MNNECPACGQEWQHGDFGVVIGMIDRDQNAYLAFVHRGCIPFDAIGEDMAPRIIGREKP